MLGVEDKNGHIGHDMIVPDTRGHNKVIPNTEGMAEPYQTQRA